MKLVPLAIGGAASVLLAACGGGGGSSSGSNTATPAAATFSVARATNQVHVVGYQASGNISGTVSANGQSVAFTGTAQLTAAPPTVATTFNGQSALEGTVTITGSLTVNGQTDPFALSENTFVNASNQAPLGVSGPNNYCVVSSFTPPPTAGTVGATGQLMVANCYVDSTMSTPTGTQTETYVISAGTTSSNAKISIIDQMTNASNQVVEMGQVDLLVDSSGTVTLQDVKETVIVNGVTVSFTIQ